MSSSGILQGKRAVIFGAAGSIGSAAAREFAAEGAAVFLSGQTKAKVDAVARANQGGGGPCPCRGSRCPRRRHGRRLLYIDDVVEEAGGIEIEFNAVGPLARTYGNGKHAIDLTIDEFMVPVITVLKAQFITARSAARHMLKQRAGVIIFLTGSPARGHVEGTTAIGAAFGAVETLMENLAVELSPNGVRVVCLRTTANVDSRPIQDTMEALAGNMNIPKDQMIARIASLNFLKVPASVADTAKAAALLGSDRVRMVTGTVFNSTAGAALD